MAQLRRRGYSSRVVPVQKKSRAILQIIHSLQRRRCAQTRVLSIPNYAVSHAPRYDLASSPWRRQATLGGKMNYSRRICVRVPKR